MSDFTSNRHPQRWISIGLYLRKVRTPVFFGAASLVLINVLDSGLPLIVRNFVDTVTVDATSSRIPLCIAVYLLCAGVQSACRFLWRVYLGAASVLVAREARDSVVDAALRSETHPDPGRTVALVQSDTEAFARAFDGGIIISIDAFLNIVLIPIILFSLDASLAWKVLLPLPCISLFVAFLDSKLSATHKKTQEDLSTLTELARQFVVQARTIKVNTAERACAERFARQSGRYQKRGRELLLLEAMMGPGMEFFISLALVSLVVFGTSGAFAGVISLGTFLAFHKYVEQLQWPMRAVAFALITFRKANVSGKRLDTFIQIHRSVVQSVVLARRVEQPPKESSPRLGLREVSFRHHNSHDAQVKSATLSVKSGEMVGIVGPIGAGKTTFVEGLVGLVPQVHGEISVNGVELSQATLHEVITVVPQEPLLLGVSIFENVALGTGNDDPVSFQSVWEALEIAGIDEEIRGFPDQLLTIVGEKGVSLSGGQRQRISLARALMRKPSILILDNSLAAVDPETEKRVFDALRRRQVTVLCVTHRLSTLARMDTVLVMERGEITHYGEINTSTTSWLSQFLRAQQSDSEEKDTLGGTVD